MGCLCCTRVPGPSVLGHCPNRSTCISLREETSLAGFSRSIVFWSTETYGLSFLNDLHVDFLSRALEVAFRERAKKKHCAIAIATKFEYRIKVPALLSRCLYQPLSLCESQPASHVRQTEGPHTCDWMRKCSGAFRFKGRVSSTFMIE